MDCYRWWPSRYASLPSISPSTVPYYWNLWFGVWVTIVGMCSGFPFSLVTLCIAEAPLKWFDYNLLWLDLSILLTKSHVVIHAMCYSLIWSSTHTAWFLSLHLAIHNLLPRPLNVMLIFPRIMSYLFKRKSLLRIPYKAVLPDISVHAYTW